MTSSDNLTGGSHGYRRRRRQSNRRRFLILGALLVAAALAVVYYIFFRISNIYPRQVAVNGENVQQLDGFIVHSRLWVSEPEAQTFFKRIQVQGLALTSVPSKTYKGVRYIPAASVAADLNRAGDRSQLTKQGLSVNLKPNQHYTYVGKDGKVAQQEIWMNGKLAGRVLTVNHDGANYVPVASVASFLTKAGVHSSWNANILTLAWGKTVAPTSIFQSNDYSEIQVGNGTSIYAPVLHWQQQTYLPDYSISAALAQLGWASAFGSWQWTLDSSGTDGIPQGTVAKAASGGTPPVILPALRTSAKPLVLGFVPYYYAGDLSAFNDVVKHTAAYNAMAEDVWTVDSSGSLVGSAPAGTASQATAAGDKVYAMVTNLGKKGFDSQVMTTILTSTTKRSALAKQISDLVETEGFSGAMLDFEMVPPSDRAAYTAFVSQLASFLHQEDKRLDVVVPAETGSSDHSWNAAYNQTGLGKVADQLVLMAYDYSYVGGPAGPIAPLPWVQQVLAYSIAHVPANKIVLGIDTYGYDWAGKVTTAVSLTNVDKFLTKHHIRPKWDANAQAPWFTWTDSHGVEHTVYYENAKSTTAKLALAKAYGISGVAIWRAGLENDSVLNVLTAYEKKK